MRNSGSKNSDKTNYAVSLLFEDGIFIIGTLHWIKVSQPKCFQPNPAVRARMIACARFATCNLLKIFET